MGHHSFFACRHPYAERRSEGPQSALTPKGLPPQNTESAPLLPFTPASVKALLTTRQCSLHATARQVACPPGLVRPGASLRPPRTFTSELARGQSPGPRVGYHYTALLGENGDRTFTGWSAAVRGCTFRRKVSIKTIGFITRGRIAPRGAARAQVPRSAARRVPVSGWTAQSPAAGGRQRASFPDRHRERTPLSAGVHRLYHR